MRDKKRPVTTRLDDAREKHAFADAQLDELDGLTQVLLAPPRAKRQRAEIKRIYLFWLVATRQVSTSIDGAGRAGGSPPPFAEWWNGLTSDPSHAFFRRERNAGLKEAAEIVTLKEVVDSRIEPVAYWTFASGPHYGDPLVGRCQLYSEWLYEGGSLRCQRTAGRANDRRAPRLTRPFQLVRVAPGGVLVAPAGAYLRSAALISVSAVFRRFRMNLSSVTSIDSPSQVPRIPRLDRAQRR